MEIALRAGSHGLSEAVKFQTCSGPGDTREGTQEPQQGRILPARSTGITSLGQATSIVVLREPPVYRRRYPQGYSRSSNWAMTSSVIASQTRSN